jgi:predicted pyridoxine 5'-phosphate oxidase superfamily flavin-nucleotide-binding protein
MPDDYASQLCVIGSQNNDIPYGPPEVLAMERPQQGTEHRVLGETSQQASWMCPLSFCVR